MDWDNKLAATGFFFAVPDFFYGDPFELGEDGFAALPGWIKHHAPLDCASIVEMFRTSKQDEAFEDAKPVLEALRSKGASKFNFNLWENVSVDIESFVLFSAKVVVELSKHDYIKAASLCRPSFVTLDDIKAVKVPTQILGAEIDGTSPPELVKQFEEALAARSEKVEHGWTTRYNVEDEAACKAAEEAYEDLMEWFLNLLYYEEAFSDISE
ncbi:unnamed protein product [Malus baccata var. baccata]